ncbi:hypothetical protein [Geobacillus jurassicus]|uniref:Uncharacterized protein n=1 Tax=Geobacillus jurassicus TaxID=235932 RepID=A0ABV6GRF5_9BACL|nr:hypothetical protein [Geobacillus jurassicus]
MADTGCTPLPSDNECVFIPLEQVTVNRWMAAALTFPIDIGFGTILAAEAFSLVTVMLVVLKGW